MNGLVLALIANLLFSFSSFFIARYTVSFGSLWTNTFKNTIAFLCFLLSALMINPHGFPDAHTILLLLFSGFIGLGIGDLFILRSFAELGPTRVIVLYGLTPFFVAVIRFFTMDQELSIAEVIPTIFFSLCLLTFALERKKVLGNWDSKALLWGLLGVFFDATGVVLTRLAFEQAQGLTSFHANVIRCFGSLIVLFLILKIKRISFFRPIRKTQGQKRLLLFTIPITGTFLSLLCYLQAIKVGNLVIVTALGVAGPITSSLIESFFQKKLPSSYLFTALGLFILGILAKVYFL